MTKVGENNLPPKQNTEETIRKSIETSALRFENALASYQNTTDANDRIRLKGVMDDSLKLINQAISGIKQQTGMGKQQEKVQGDYKKFIASGSDQDFAALEHDIQTLRDYNRDIKH